VIKCNHTVNTNKNTNMKNKNTQFILHKILLIAFISICILSTAASCSSEPVDKYKDKIINNSISLISSTTIQETSIQSKTSLLNKLKDKFSKSKQDEKPESGTLDQRTSQISKNENTTPAKEQENIVEKSIQIQTNVEPTPKITETQKPILIKNDPIIEKVIEMPMYTTPKIIEQQLTTPIISQTPPKEIITAPVENILPTNIPNQSLSIDYSKLTCKDIGHKVYIGNPDYLPKFDTDNDGIGCESFKK
jgi:hypothetical protein